MVDLSIVIVNYNVRVFLESCLTSVTKALDGISGEIIVVDNASEDGSVEMIRQKFPGVTLIANQVNVGFGKANNQGAQQAQGEFLFLLNPDTIVQEDTFHTVIEFFKITPDAGLVGCKVLNPDGTLQPACRRSFPTPWVAFTKIVGLSSIFPSVPLFSRYNLSYLNPDKTYEVDAVSGSCMAIRKSVFEKITGFDEQFFMYGEDLDICFRIKQAGWNVYYLHTTQIIHYKGESVRRSNIDEIRVFYQAMHVFVHKHFKYGALADVMLKVGIIAREFVARIHKYRSIIGAMIIDYIFVVTSWFLAEFLRFGEVLHFPHSAYFVLFSAPPLILIMTLMMFDVYSARKHSSAKTLSSVITGFVILSALTFFFNEYAYSRIVLFVAGVVSSIFLIGWRIAVRSQQHPGMFTKRTLIVGVGERGSELLTKLRKKDTHGYEIIGFVDADTLRIGERVDNIEILGTIDSIGRIIKQYSISDVIISNEKLSYSEIVSVIGNSSDKSINYRLVPGSLEVIIGKTHIDELNEVPLIDIEYNIHRLPNRIVKRCVDIVLGFLLLLFIYPFVRVSSSPSKKKRGISDGLIHLPSVLSGKMTLVGFIYSPNVASVKHLGVVGKPGITGLAQVNNFDKLLEEEIAQYNIYYAKNQSLMLDLEILLKTLALSIKE